VVKGAESAESEEEIMEVQPVRRKQVKIPLDLLDERRSNPNSGDINANREIIRRTFENFNIHVEMAEVNVGPTVTQYTMKPAEGIKLTKIITLNNDLALALAAHPIRIEAPIPGRSLIGIEVPNKSGAVVGLKDLLMSREYRKVKKDGVLALPLGLDVAGKSYAVALEKMPHLLVAGATGSGKSVAVNAMILSLLYQYGPDSLRFIMVDPKRVELPVYNRVPHMLTPVITDVKKTINALKWLITEMDHRYETLAAKGKRNIMSYNEVADEPLPYIVLIIDELADLMIVAAQDVETYIIRLAQMARAVGIHLILATQRPSVDVITGLLKANIPGRIAFSVASAVDSRTILDTYGAEKLVGRGDMLFSSAEVSKPKRIQGPYVSEHEVKRIVSFLADEIGEPQFIEEVTEKQSTPTAFQADDGDGDDLFEEAKDIVVKAQKASTSYLQRKLRIGYARAARLMDLLEDAGIIGSADGSRAREVLIRPGEDGTMEGQTDQNPGFVDDTAQEKELPSDEDESDDEEGEERKAD
jgi:S-DNA-T family DNA segregation ATPase FtsK/SpoIIIE